MKRILVVDDEPLFREGLVQTIQWEQLGAETPEVAINGLDALNKLQNGSFDLVITDIRMPKMDGLELIRQAAARYPDIGFIVLSAYDEFQFVKQAFHLGIVDYLLKNEISQEELSRIIQNQQAFRKLPGHAASSTLEEYAMQNEKHIKQMLLQNLVRGIVPEQEGIKALGIPQAIQGGRIYAASAKLHPLSGYSSTIGTEHTEAIRVVQQFLDSFPEICSIIEHDAITLFLLSETPRDWAMLDSYWQKIHSEMNQLLKPLDCCISLGFSHNFTTFNSLSKHLKEAEYCLSWYISRGKGLVFSPPRLKARPTDPDAFPNTGTLATDLAALHAEQAASLVLSLRLIPEKVRASEPQAILEYLHRLAAHIHTTGELLELQHTPAFKELLAGLKQHSGWDVQDINRWLEELAGFFQSLSTITNRNIQVVLELLQRIYAEEISLSSVAEQLGMNPSYLSRIFSRELGMGFTAYVAQLRIKQAVVLFEAGNNRVVEVAERVGIPQPETFSRVFKRVMGVSPQAYIQSLSKKMTL